jgi:CRP/FNR family transcriptional regulator, cyclic AMP receptor protein
MSARRKPSSLPSGAIASRSPAVSKTEVMEWKLFAPLTPEEQRRVIGQTHRRRFKRGEVIFHEGDPGDSMHLIAKGHVAVRRSTPLGEVATLLVLGPGDFFGELVLVSPDSGRNATAVALDAAETLSLHRTQMDELRRDNPTIDRFLLDAMAKEIRRMSTLLSEALYVSVEKRVYRRLLEVARTYGTNGPAQVVPLTQEDLAGLAGTTRPSANKALRSIEDAGIISMSRGEIRVLDHEGLAHRAR